MAPLPPPAPDRTRHRAPTPNRTHTPHHRPAHHAHTLPRRTLQVLPVATLHPPPPLRRHHRLPPMDRPLPDERPPTYATIGTAFNAHPPGCSRAQRDGPALLGTGPPRTRPHGALATRDGPHPAPPTSVGNGATKGGAARAQRGVAQPHRLLHAPKPMGLTPKTPQWHHGPMNTDTRTRRRRRRVLRRTAPPVPDPVTQILSGISTSQKARFRGRGITIGHSPTVHRTAHVDWIAGLTLPAPECHTNPPLDPTRVRPSTAPVNCRRCLYLATRQRQRHTPDPRQETLF